MSFRFRDFSIYQDIRSFVKEIYQLCSKLPKQEQFELASQLRRASTSVLLNLAEGSMKRSDAEFNRFLMISIGSVSEIVAILDISFDLKYINTSTHQKFMLKCESIVKRLYGFSRKLKS
ncbi:four helix bundle protein [Candidatus Daviesbacteria bacterium]|nr:four helix bundle protein [Candidatus Daviesbacteria bacterium]